MYEDQVHPAVADVASVYGDVARASRARGGRPGTRRSDEVVTLNSEDTGGVVARRAMEMRDRKQSLRRILEDLAMRNKEATAGIAVISRQGHAPGTEPLPELGTEET